MKKYTLLLAAAVAGCHDHTAPHPTACHDYRIITIYDNVRLPWDNEAWSDAYTLPVCVVGETKLTRSPVGEAP